MPTVPDDLIRLPDVLAQYKPKRTWWDTQIAQGKIQAYRVPGDKALYLSKAAVDALTAPRPYVRGEQDEDAS